MFPGVQDIVQLSSINQALKGIITAGLQKSVFYSMAKVKKKLKSLQQK